VYKIKEAS
jgi:hypothetical protein